MDLKGLDVDELFLAFSGSGGQTQRHCEMRWCKGTEIGVKFIKASAKKKAPAAAGSLMVIGLLKELS